MRVKCKYCERLATPACATCQRCRQYLRSVLKLEDLKAVERVESSVRRYKLCSTVATVKNGHASFVDESSLVKLNLMFPSRKLRQKSKATVTSIKGTKKSSKKVDMRPAA